MTTAPTTSVPILNPLPPTHIPPLIPLALAPPAPAPALVIPPAPTGIDPAVWANNQALILSLLPALQALYCPPAQPLPPKEGDVKAPTSFSGEDHSKLRNFLFECGLIFETKPCTFATEKSHVLYTIQHLNGMAKWHFCCYIEAGGTDPKVNQWNIFTTKLETVFGNPDQLGRASEKLLGLKMKETSRVHQFTILFREAANELNWPNTILHRLYYNGLPDCIKDLWAKTDPPADFKDLIRKAQHADNHYWKHINEQKKSDAKQPCSSEPKSSSKASSSTQMNQKSSASSSSSQPCASTSSSQSKSTSSTPTMSKSTSSAKDLSKILGPDGKLLPKEKARCKRLGLCSYCSKDHPPPCDLRPKSKEASSSDKLSSSSSNKLNSNSSGSKPKGRVAQVIDSVPKESDHDSSSDQSHF